jgi:V/A-type H+-transporting ATPase subunit F
VRYHVIGDRDTVLGFRMVGVSGSVAESEPEAVRAFEDALKDRNIGIFVITERTADLIRPLVDRYLYTEQFPLVLEIPDRRGPIEGRPTMRELVNAAIGISL